MMCPDCGLLRHTGTECEDLLDWEFDADQPDKIEMLQADAELAWHRYIKAKRENDEHAR
jgi:hypothetical protein